MFSQGGRSNININASKGNDEGIWARDEKNSSISDVIPLTLKDGNGVPYAILNNIIVTVGISSAAYYGGFKSVTLPQSWQCQLFRGLSQVLLQIHTICLELQD